MGGRWGEQTQGHDTTVSGQLHLGTALASALSEQHKFYDFCTYSMEFTPGVTCHPGSAALSLQVGTALHSACLHFSECEDNSATFAFITVFPSSLCHLEKQKAKGKKKVPIAMWQFFLQLSRIGHTTLNLSCITWVIWKHVLLWCALIQLQGVHWWNDAKILIVINEIEVRTNHEPDWAILRFYGIFFKRNPREKKPCQSIYDIFLESVNAVVFL